MKPETYIKQAQKLLDELIKLTEDNMVTCDRQIKITDHANRIKWRIDLTEDSDMRAISMSLEQMPIEHLEFSIRTKIALADHGVNTLGDLYRLGWEKHEWLTKRMIKEIVDVTEIYREING